jgi:hypothetical protein
LRPPARGEPTGCALGPPRPCTRGLFEAGPPASSSSPRPATGASTSRVLGFGCVCWGGGRVESHLRSTLLPSVPGGTSTKCLRLRRSHFGPLRDYRDVLQRKKSEDYLCIDIFNVTAYIYLYIYIILYTLGMQNAWERGIHRLDLERAPSCSIETEPGTTKGAGAAGAEEILF